MKKILYFLTCMSVLLVLTGCTNETTTLNEKVEDELDYFSTKFVNILNRLNNITFENYEVVAQDVNLSKETAEKEKTSESSSQQESSGPADVKSSEDNAGENIIAFQMSPNTILNPVTTKIDWPGIKNEIENIYYSWNTILLDLYELDVSNEEILNFSKDLDLATTYIKKEDKVNSLLAMANLYKYLFKYAEKISNNEIYIDIIKTRSYILNAYSLIDTGDWNAVNEEINKAVDTYRLLANDTSFISDNNYSSNKVYVLLNELKNSLVLEDKEIFYIKYKNLLEEMVELQS